MERPDLELAAPDKGSGKSYSPAKGTLQSQMLLTGSTLDPMRGRFVDENSPQAKAILKQQRQQILEAQGKSKNHIRDKTMRLEPGHRVMHASRGKGVVKKHPEGNKVEVIFAQGQIAKVQIANLEKI